MTPSPAALAALLAADHAGDRGLDVIERYNFDGVQLAIVRVDGALGAIWRGTSEPTRDGLTLEWLRRNLKPFPYRAIGSNAVWCRGFFGYAVAGVAFFSYRGIEWQAGHSLAAAAAQIALPQLRVPTVCFGSPRPLFRWDGRPDLLAECRSLLRIYNVRQDVVTWLPWPGPTWLGEPVWLDDPAGTAWTPGAMVARHGIANYGKLLAQAGRKG